MSYEKEWAINKAMQYHKQSNCKKTYVVVHDPDSYMDFYRGVGFKVWEKSALIKEKGEMELLKVIFHTRHLSVDDQAAIYA